MKTQVIQPSNINFKSARISIIASSDSHGQLNSMSEFCAQIENNADDIFLKEQPGNKNVFAYAGDWFMAGNVKGYKSNPEFNSQRYQLMFFNKLVKWLQKFSSEMQVIFSPGNHEFDAGEEEFKNIIERLYAKVILTNADLKNSPLLSNLFQSKKITNSHIVDVADDKNPQMRHRVLFVSAVPGNMSYYNKKIKNINFSDNIYKSQSELQAQDVENSINAIKKEIEAFKKKYPKGAVVLMDHFAGIFQRELLKQNLPIDVILSAHEHYNEEYYHNSTFAMQLSQNFSKLANIKIKFDDEGNLEDITSKAYYSEQSEKNAEISAFYDKIFIKDIEDRYTIPSRDNVKLELKNIRNQNSFLANYITDVITYQIRQKYPDVDFFSINASAIRGQLKTDREGKIDNTNLLLTLNGIKQEDADILISKVTGGELLEIICDNLASNKTNPNKNPLMHYSGLVIEKKDIIRALESGAHPAELCNMVTQTKNGEPILPHKTYVFANVEKMFIKSKNEFIKELYKDPNRTFKTELNAKKVFREYFEQGLSDKIYASAEIRYI